MNDDKPTLREPAVERELRPLVDRYRSGDEIARGGMGRVVEAVDTRLDRVVAVKEALTADPEHLRRFARETRITAKLEHPSIVPLYDASAPGDAPYYVMRRVSGRPLEKVIAETPNLADRLALVPHVLAAAQAIAHAHGRRILHRDVKPANILVGELGETVVIDWGLAKEIGEADEGGPELGDSLHTRVGQVVGTPGFMSPEQCTGEPADARGDVYALGATLYYLLARRPPHAGATGTAMIAAAAAGPAQPVGELVPGVPRELSAIVDTALAFDAAARYPHAGAFADDLARFLRGQLVASHRYSRRERLVRLVRRHRAAFAIGTIALVVVAVGAALSVSRIIAERDRADQEAELADRGRVAAEAAGARERDRADQLLLARARGLVDANPTAAIATLLQLAADSPRVPEARGVAKEAVMRGVAYALQGPGTTSRFVQLRPDGKRLLIVTVDGRLQGFDLETRRRVLDRQLSRNTAGAAWYGERVAVFDERVYLLDPATGATTDVAAMRLHHVVTTPDGARAAGATEDQQVALVDFATTTVRTAPIPKPTDELAIAPDGSWYAVTAKRGVTVFDWSGTELTRSPEAEVMNVAVSPQRIAFGDGHNIYRATATAAAVWDTVRPELPSSDRVIALVFGGDRLFADAGRTLLVETPTGMAARHRFETSTSTWVALGEGRVAHALDDGRAEVIDTAGIFTIAFPNPVPKVRLVATPRSDLLIAVGGSSIVVFDTKQFVPREVPAMPGPHITFADDRTLVASVHSRLSWAWFDLAGGAVRSGPDGIGLFDTPATDPDRTRVGLLGMMLDHENRAVVASREHPPRVFGQRVDVMQLVAGDGVVFAEGAKLYAAVGQEHAKELASFAHPVQAVANLGRLRVAAATDEELLRADLATGAIERAHLPSPAHATHLAGWAGAPIVGRGTKLLRWTDEIATFRADITHLLPATGGVLVALADATSWYVALDGSAPDAHPVLAANETGNVNATGSMIAINSSERIEIVELPSRTRWRGPRKLAATGTIQISPAGRQLLATAADGRAFLWPIPSPESDLQAWIRSVTNAVEDGDGVLHWPWEGAR